MWSYDVYVWDPEKGWGGMRDDAGLEAMLERKGEEGWELVTIVNDRGMRFFFKQPKV
jgi:hypothetical protein